MKKITIITPVFNSERFIELTIQSVISLIKQQVEIEYLVIDGGSTDKTLDIINKYRDHISQIISTADTGMYDALVKGIKISSGDYIAYINAGDLLFQTAIVSIEDEIFAGTPLITCRKVLLNDRNQVISDLLPSMYFTSNILAGFNAKPLEYIQQESTVFKKDLILKSELEKLSKFKYAGDYYIWFIFAEKGIKPKIINTLFGAFRIHPGQLSENKDLYVKELKYFTKYKLNIFKFLLSLFIICTYRFSVIIYIYINSITKLK